MSVGSLPSIRPSQNQAQGQGANADGGSGEEFSLEKQQAGAASLATLDKKKKARRKGTTEIVDKKSRNRKGAPRTIIVDGDIYEVFLLAIA